MQMRVSSSKTSELLLLFEDAAPVPSSHHTVQETLQRFSAECEAVMRGVSNSKSYVVVLCKKEMMDRMITLLTRGEQLPQDFKCLSYRLVFCCCWFFLFFFFVLFKTKWLSVIQRSTGDSGQYCMTSNILSFFCFIFPSVQVRILQSLPSHLCHFLLLTICQNSSAWQLHSVSHSWIFTFIKINEKYIILSTSFCFLNHKKCVSLKPNNI